MTYARRFFEGEPSPEAIERAERRGWCDWRPETACRDIYTNPALQEAYENGWSEAAQEFA